MNVLDLFSGIGGFSLGLERAGMRTVAFCEIDPYCQAVLAKHWPDVPCYGDIRTMRAIDIPADLVCGGFPCQPFSSAARGRNRADGNLWPEMRRVISECRPAWVICENVIDLDRLAIRQVVADLEGLGYEVAPPLEIPACAVGHDHRRARLWICGHADRESKSGRALDGEVAGLLECGPIARNDRATDGISNRVHRLRALGNAIVPQIAELIGRAILNVERAYQNEVDPQRRQESSRPSLDDGTTTRSQTHLPPSKTLTSERAGPKKTAALAVTPTPLGTLRTELKRPAGYGSPPGHPNMAD